MFLRTQEKQRLPISLGSPIVAAPNMAPGGSKGRIACSACRCFNVEPGTRPGMAQPIRAGMTQHLFSPKKKKWKLHSHAWKDSTEILTSCSFPHFLKKIWLYLSTMPVAMVQAPSRHGPQGGKLWSCCITFDSLHGQCLFRKRQTTCGTCGWKMVEISHHMKFTWPTLDKANTSQDGSRE